MDRWTDGQIDHNMAPERLTKILSSTVTKRDQNRKYSACAKKKIAFLNHIK